MKENARVLTEEIDKFSGNHLKRKNDLLTLINLGYTGDRENLIDELSFTSKYIQGLFRVLQQSSSIPDVQNIDLIKRDISVNLGKVKDKIEQLIMESDEKTRQYFRENYLRMAQDSLVNLFELMNDLEWTKKYLNHLKRENPS